MSPAEIEKYAVIAGHGATLFSQRVSHPFCITILREPISLFQSQFYYLRVSPHSNFLSDVSALSSIEEYLDYALAHGQDNLMTRFLSGNIHWLVDPSQSVPDMPLQGERLLETALDYLAGYDAIIDLDSFDAGIYSLSRMLGWKHLPVYRPANVNPVGKPPLSYSFLNHLKEKLKYDIILYRKFREAKWSVDHRINKKSWDYRLFTGKLAIARAAAKLTGR